MSSQLHLLWKECIVLRKLWFVCAGYQNNEICKGRHHFENKQAKLWRRASQVYWTQEWSHINLISTTVSESVSDKAGQLSHSGLIKMPRSFEPFLGRADCSSEGRPSLLIWTSFNISTVNSLEKWTYLPLYTNLLTAVRQSIWHRGNYNGTQVLYIDIKFYDSLWTILSLYLSMLLCHHQPIWCLARITLQVISSASE